MTPPAPTLSVIVPTYNRADYVRRCLTGLARSGVADQEVIVADDGSTDGTREAVAAADPAPLYLWQPNSGTPSTARNAGFARSRGRYVAFLDCDDEWHPGPPAEAVALLDRHPEVDVLFADADMGSREGGFVSWIGSAGGPEFFRLPHRELEPGFRLLAGDALFRRMAVRNPVFLGSVILRREAFERCGPFDEGLRGAADWNLWLRMAAQLRFGYWDRRLSIYTKHPEGMSADLDGMSREFCEALGRLPTQAPLTPGQRAWARRQWRHHLWGYAYRAYDRGDYPEARRRFAALFRAGGARPAAVALWAACGLPAWAVRAARRIKRGGGR